MVKLTEDNAIEDMQAVIDDLCFQNQILEDNVLQI